jgi:hypothetical protein
MMDLSPIAIAPAVRVAFGIFTTLSYPFAIAKDLFDATLGTLIYRESERNVERL